jgi:outer membrane protein assembly factor BamB
VDERFRSRRPTLLAALALAPLAACSGGGGGGATLPPIPSPTATAPSSTVSTSAVSTSATTTVTTSGSVGLTTVGVPVETFDPTGAVPGQVVAVRATDGVEVWRADTPAVPSNVVATGGIVVVGGGDVCGPGPAQVSAHEAATGRTLWARDVQLVAPTAPRQQLAAVGGVLALLDRGQVVGLDLATGAPRWSQASDAGIGPVAGGGFFVVANGVEGTLTTPELTALRAADGAVGWTATLAGPAQVLTLTQGGGRMFVNYYTADAAFRTLALDAATGRRLWDEPVTVDDAATDVVISSRGDQVAALDAATGRQRWERPGSLGVIGDGLVVALDNQQAPAAPPSSGAAPTVPAEFVARASADGTDRWRVEAVLSAPFVAGDVVLLSGPQTVAYRLADGARLWTSATVGIVSVGREGATDRIAMAVGGEAVGCGD